jgi:hypothetical protein
MQFVFSEIPPYVGIARVFKDRKSLPIIRGLVTPRNEASQTLKLSEIPPTVGMTILWYLDDSSFPFNYFLRWPFTANRRI